MSDGAITRAGQAPFGEPAVDLVAAGAGLVGELDLLVTSGELLDGLSEASGRILDGTPESYFATGLPVGDRDGDGLLVHVQPDKGLCAVHDPFLPGDERRWSC